MADEASSSAEPPKAKPKLSVQDLSTLNVAELDALSPQVISRQATINIGAPEPAWLAPPTGSRASATRAAAI